jgi:hypothetical protein
MGDTAPQRGTPTRARPRCVVPTASVSGPSHTVPRHRPRLPRLHVDHEPWSPRPPQVASARAPEPSPPTLSASWRPARLPRPSPSFVPFLLCSKGVQSHTPLSTYKRVLLPLLARTRRAATAIAAAVAELALRSLPRSLNHLSASPRAPSIFHCHNLLCIAVGFAGIQVAAVAQPRPRRRRLLELSSTPPPTLIASR